MIFFLISYSDLKIGLLCVLYGLSLIFPFCFFLFFFYIAFSVPACLVFSRALVRAKQLCVVLCPDYCAMLIETVYLKILSKFDEQKINDDDDDDSHNENSNNNNRNPR